MDSRPVGVQLPVAKTVYLPTSMDHCGTNQVFDAVERCSTTITAEVCGADAKNKNKDGKDLMFFRGMRKKLRGRYADCRKGSKELGMDPQNRSLTSDFLRFVMEKEIYQKAGKAWKRLYFFYNTPDSKSLIAAAAKCLKFSIHVLDPPDLLYWSELRMTNMLASIPNRSLILIDHRLRDFNTVELKGSCLLEFVYGLVSSCGDEQIIAFATDNRDLHDAALQHPFNEYVYIHKSSPRPDEGEIVKEGENVDEGEIVDGGEIVQFDIIKQKPLVDVDLNFPPVEEKIRNPEIKKKGDCNQSPSASSTVTHVKSSSWKGFEELGMDPENTGIISDLKRFKLRKESFKLFGKSLMRFYLLYDPPGADRSSLIAAMADYLEYRTHNLDVTSFSSLSELRNMLASITNRSLIWIQDSDQCAGMLPDLNTNELRGSCLLKFVDGLLLSCGDERIIVFTTNNRDLHDAALRRPFNQGIYIHKSSPRPVALPAEGEIVQLNSFEQKPLVDFDATNSRAHQSIVFVSNPEKKNTREISKRRCMAESVRSLIDSTTRTSSTDFDAPDNKAHLLRAHQSSFIAFNSEKKDTIEGLHRECLTNKVLSLDDSGKQESLLDFDATENKAHLFRAYQIDPVVSLSENKNRGEALKSNVQSLLVLEDLQQHCGDRRDVAAKTFGTIYDPGFHTPDSLAWKSFEVLETLPTEEQPFDCVPLLAQGRLPLEGCVQQEKSPDLPRVMQINGVEQRVTKMHRYLGGLTTQSASSSRWPISLPDGGHIVLLDPFDQSTKNIEHVARADQCSPTVFIAEKKMVRKCRTMSVIFEENHLHFGRRCEGAAKSLGAMRICRKHGINQVCTLKRIHKQHGIHQWPFRQKWATRKGYYLGEERPFEVRRLSMDEKLDSRLQLIHMSQFARSSPQALALPDGGEIVRPTVLSSSEFAAMNNRAHLVGQDQSGSTASHYKCKNTRDTSDKQGLEDLQQHFGCKHKHALKSLGVSGSMFKSTCKQHWFYWWLGQFENNEQQAFDATSNRAHLVKADERVPTVSNALSLEDLRHQFGARCKESAKGLRDSLAWKSFKVLDSLPLVEQSNTRRRSLTHKHCVRLKKSQDLPRSVLRGCSGGLTAQSDIGLPDGGHILSFSEKKIVRKTLKRKCRTTSVLSLEDHQQHVGRRWEDTVKFLGVKRISRQLVIQCETIAKCIRRQLGTRRWLFKQSAIGFPDGGHILSLSEKKIVRKTIKRKCRNTSVLSLEDHKQHVDRWWEDAAKSHGAKRICRQLGIHRLSIAKRTHKQHGIHQWPFQQSAIGSPDGRHVLPLSEKKMVRKTLKRKCRSMSVLSLVDRQQHVDRRWEDATKNIGVKRICRQLVIHRVSIAKRICRQHGIHHRWPFERDWATMKGYSLGDKRPVEVISLSTHAKLVPRLQLIYISWLGRFSPRPLALAGGGEIGGPIALSLSESAATKNIAQHVGQDQSGSAASDSENERTREQGDPEEINATITLHDIRRHYGRRNREDAAASLAISVSTFKRKCREYGIKRWPHVRKRKVGRPPDQHGEGNTSTARETPSHYVQTGMEGELVGQNEVANVFQRDFMGGPIALNTESGLIMVSRPPDQHGERNTSTACGTPSRNVETGMEVEPVGQNQEANVFHRDFMYGPIALNTDGLTFHECSNAVAPSQPMATILDTIPHLNGGSSECAFQVKNQSMQFTANPYPNGLVDPHPQIALTQILSENMERLEDRRNLLAPRKEPLPEGHVFGSVNWTVHSCSDVALSQPMTTIPHTTGCSEYWRNSLALLEEHLLEENDYGSINLTAPSCFDPGPSQPMHTIPHTMPTIPQTMPLLTERQDMRSVRLKATYGNTTIKFPLPSGFSELKEEVSKRLEFERGSFKLEYKDEEGDSVLIACDEDVRDYLRLLTSLGNQVVKLFVLDKVPNTTNFCDNCRSLKC